MLEKFIGNFRLVIVLLTELMIKSNKGYPDSSVILK